jgi:hypothetical protein
LVLKPSQALSDVSTILRTGRSEVLRSWRANSKEGGSKLRIKHISKYVTPWAGNLTEGWTRTSVRRFRTPLYVKNKYKKISNTDVAIYVTAWWWRAFEDVSDMQ